MNITDRVVLKFAKLSKEQKDEAVDKVMKNIKNKDDKSKDKDEKKSKSKAKGKSKSKKDDSEKEVVDKEVVVDEVVVDEEVDEKETEESEMAEDSGIMDSIEALSAELDAIKEDGKVDSSEVVSLFQNMMGMVNELLRAKPGRKPRASSDRVACRYLVATKGLQVRRKDKDLMSDTGGGSKGREREPSNKPPREENKKPHRKKDKPAADRDTDTDNDKDLN